MRVDVANLLWSEAGIAQRNAHGTRRAFDGWLRQMVRIGGHARARQLRINFRATRLCRFERLEQQHRAAFAQNHSFAVTAERTARIRRDHAHRLPRFQQAEALKGASLPPAIAASAAPERNSASACANAWFDDEHAVEIASRPGR